ncbi:PorT family protein [Flavihumibacter rivuli]|uniref:porin family protein n=1 Tax=Flavihumibacter rivuli TaxID=2838156 RepID=UPI001BDE2D4A|nr:porin family protein [Flavihumibacter rivuli]ULQ57915.1 PorT family protein [Flavihumibacter rivuli]
MKKILLLSFLAFMGYLANAQVQFGAKAGVNFSTLVGDDSEGAKTHTSFYGGAFARFSINESIKFQPELVYSALGTKADDQDVSGEFRFGYITVPIMFQYHTPGGFFGETGPQLGFLVNSKVESEGTSVDFKDYTKSFDFNWAFGLGYQLKSGLGFNARYCLGLSKVIDGEALIEQEVDTKNSVIQVGLFYVFKGK